MLAGIKIGPTTWKAILPVYQPRVCEVWFRVDRAADYKETFAYLRDRQIRAGLHFWGILKGGIAPNFAFPDISVAKNSVALVKETIDIAVKNKLHYVNIHPGSYKLSTIDLDQLFMKAIPGKETTAKAGSAMLYENLTDLQEYAQKRGVLLLTETLPCREPLQWQNLGHGRMQTQDMRNVSVSVLEKLAKGGFWITNDFCHTAMDVISADRDYLFERLLAKTKALAMQTRLIHLNTMLPPFNGTDGHLGILEEDFVNGVFPSKEQILKLLSVFKNRDDIWVIPEPFTDNVRNSLALEKLLEEI